jgi:FkbM family methyltransferase
LGKLKRKLLRAIGPQTAFTTLPVVVAGRSFQAPFLDGKHCDVSEPWMLELQSQLLAAKPGTFVDVGMNLGQTLLLVKALDPARSYVGFEPNPDCFAYCERFARLNKLSNVSMIPIGLSSANGVVALQLYSDGDFDAAASIVADFRPEQPVKAVKFVPVSRFADVAQTLAIGDIGIIKIDVEGAEWDVLESMEPAINAARPWIIIEILPCYSQENASRVSRQASIEEMLRRLDYCILRIRKNSDNSLSKLEPIEQIGIHSEIALSDYVLCPREDVNRVLTSVNERRP